MKNFLLLLFFILIVLISGCSEKPEEIKLIKQNEPVKERKESGKETADSLTDEFSSEENFGKIPERKSSGENERIRITTSEVNSNIGNKVILKGYIASVTVREKVAYLNFDNAYPKNTCSVTIFASEFEKFGDLNRFENKNVEVTGKLKEYRGKPQIIINNPGQIKILN